VWVEVIKPPLNPSLAGHAWDALRIAALKDNFNFMALLEKSDDISEHRQTTT